MYVKQSVLWEHIELPGRSCISEVSPTCSLCPEIEITNGLAYGNGVLSLYSWWKRRAVSRSLERGWGSSFKVKFDEIGGLFCPIFITLSEKYKGRVRNPPLPTAMKL